MGKINVLGFEIANLIAAGEVVDRPSSVLKELLENAIDAGGTHIVAEIRGGGVRSIRVSDDGCGMTAEDLPVALRRHATSKIKEAEDLNGIMTLGFRGEALAAISSVSRITIVSKVPDAEMGTMLVADGGEVQEICEVGAANGTTVVVEDLFGRVPARRKFLKKDASEAMSCAAVMEKVAMSHPELSFRFIIDGKPRFSTAGDGDVKNVLYALYGRDFATRLLKVDGETEGVAVTGYVGRSDNCHGNRNMQNVFINGRYVKSKTVMAALERAFTSYMAPEKFPVCALYLTTDPRHVDVNVHPAKLEVRFSDERKVFESVYWAVRAALEANTERPELRLSQQKTFTPPASQAFVPVGRAPQPEQLTVAHASPAPQSTGAQSPQTPAAAPARATTAAPRTEEMTPARSLAFLQDLAQAQRGTLQADTRLQETAPATPKTQAPVASAPVPVAETTDTESVAPDATVTETTVPPFRFIGEAFRTYLFVEVGEELLVIDQHAAHERILFEELLARQRREGRVASQGMIVPLRLSLTPEEAVAAEEYRSEVEAVGFSYTLDMAGVLLVAIPDGISPDVAGELFTDMVTELAEGTGNPSITEQKRQERALYQVACKAAIKGGRAYGGAQLEHLIAKVLALPDITVCPHGRPIAYRMTKRELDKQFDRIK